MSLRAADPLKPPFRRAPLPECHYCGRTIPKYRRDVSDFCTEKCVKRQVRDDAESAAMEREIVALNDDTRNDHDL
jgi:hypothetical protein